MIHSSPLADLHACLSSAQYVDMPECTDKRRKPNTKPFSGKSSEYIDWSNSVYEEYNRRPYSYELYVEAMFPQTWGDTSLGFGGMAGQAITTAYTVIIGHENTEYLCVYFGGRFAYGLDKRKCDMELLTKDISNQNMADVHSKGKYLERKS
jgi:hypothetical protein